MKGARAVVAGVLSATIVVMSVNMGGDDGVPIEHAALMFSAFVGVVALLVGVDAFKAYHEFKSGSKSAPPDKEPD